MVCFAYFGASAILCSSNRQSVLIYGYNVRIDDILDRYSPGHNFPNARPLNSLDISRILANRYQFRLARSQPSSYQDSLELLYCFQATSMQLFLL